MSNLGRFQDITTEAAAAGGVDVWIRNIEDSAVAERSSEIFAKGTGFGLVVAGVLAGIGGAGWNWRRRHIARKESLRRGRDEAKGAIRGMAELENVVGAGEQPTIDPSADSDPPDCEVEPGTGGEREDME